MAKEERPRDLLNYEALQQEALRGVIRSALAAGSGPQGLPGGHHFYISFRTDAAGVALPEDLKARYPEEMTIVLQNQFWDLKVGQEGFAVTLQFSGQPKGLSIPYAAVTRFYDPSVQYLLLFTPAAAGGPEGPPKLAAPEKAASGKRAAAKAAADGPKVVSLDQFRKK
jgi:hypothetical protein